MEAQRPEAASADREANAAATRAAKRLPGSKHAEALNAEIETARTQATATVDATELAWAEVAEALREHMAAWREQEQAELAKDIAAGSKALDAAQQGLDDVAERRALLKWMTQATASLGGERLLGGAIRRRFPSGVPSINGSVAGTQHDARWIIGTLRAHLEGGES